MKKIRKQPNTISPLGKMALAYGQMGWPVFPLKPLGKTPLTRQGFHDASTDVRQIRQWWKQHPNANIGLPTGESSGVIVIDVDGPKGKESLKKLNLPKTLQSKTRRGTHHFFKYPTSEVRNAVGVLPEIDIRGKGGYVVLPPSQYEGGEYEWPEEWLRDLVPFPERLIHSLASQENNTPKESPDISISEGQRNATLIKIAGSMRAHGMGRHEIEKTLSAYNRRHCVLPLEDREVKAIAKSAERYEAGTALKNTIRPTPNSQEGGLNESNGRNFFAPIDIGQFLEEIPEESAWLLKGYLGPERLTLLGGDPKVGKTTFAYKLAHNIALGLPFLGEQVQQTNVLILAMEESRHELFRRFQGTHTEQLVGKIKIVTGLLPFTTELLEQIERFIQEEKIGLVLVDTLPYWLGLEDENSAAAVLRAGRLLVATARRTQAAWFLLCHTRKAGGDHGKGIRGSNALVSFVDIALTLKRTSAHNTQRTLEAVSRTSETPPEQIIDFQNGEYELLGDSQEAKRKITAQIVLKTLSPTLSLTVEALAKKTGNSKQQLQSILNELYEKGLVKRRGEGVKGAPFKYRKNSTPAKNNPMKFKTPQMEEEVEEVVVH